MTDYSQHNFNTRFQGLTSTVAIMGAVGLTCVLGYETLRQMKRFPRRSFNKFWKPAGQRDPEGLRSPKTVEPNRDKLTQEDWEMGHLYHARTFHATTPSPPLARRPLMWVWQSLKLDEWFYATHCGMDNAVYVRFLRGMVWWTLLHTLTTAPILISINFIYSLGVSTLDMSRASLSYLVVYPQPSCTEEEVNNCPKEVNERGRRLLWIHFCLLWYITLTWFYALWWIGKGSLKTRRRLIQTLYDPDSGTDASAQKSRVPKAAEADAVQEQSRRSLNDAHGLMLEELDDSSRGWRQRTVMVTNVPASLRAEASIRRYFEEYLRPEVEGDRGATRSSDGREPSLRAGEKEVEHQMTERKPDHFSDGKEDAGANPSACRTTIQDGPAALELPSPVQTVIVVRKMGELSAMLARRADILQQIEAAHIKLAQSVLQKVSQQQQRKRHDRGRSELNQSKRRGGSVLSFLKRSKVPEENSPADDQTPHHAPLDELTSRLAKFCDLDTSFHKGSANGLLEERDAGETVWEAMAQIPRALLDPYQPVTRLSVLFRGQRVPTIDYLLAKLNLLTALIAEMKTRPPTDYEATSTAFVTFRDPRQARMVWRELNSQLVMKVKMAPEVKDIDWDRLMSVSFTSSLLRGFSVNAFFWAFTILWVIPLSIISTALFSVQRLTRIFPVLERAFASNPELESFVAVTLPSLLVSLATMTVPEITFQISKRGQGFTTWSSLYDRCLCRYWKFLVCNVLIFFCIGVTTVEAILQQIISAPGENQILNNVAYAFPTAAPFFVSYFILALALHSGFELVGFMVPLIVHFTGANKASTPRQRALKTIPRNFNRYYWLPFHTLIMTILFVFAILNPLVIPFGLVYVFVAMVVFKRSFAFVYYRRFMEKDGVVYFIRILRYSCDGLLIAQVVALIFFSVTNQERAYIALTAVLIPITVVFKVVGTRLWKSQCRAIADHEANAICGIATRHTSQADEHSIVRPTSSDDIEAGKSQAQLQIVPSDARASGRFPVAVRPPPTDSKFMMTWQKLHDTFHADGADRPSYLAQRAAEGKPVRHPAFTGATLVLRAPFAVAKKARSDGKHFATVAKLSLGVDDTSKAEATQGSREDNLQSESTAVESRIESGKQAMHDRQVDRKASIRAQPHEMTRSRSGRSIAHRERAPFLSGFEALTNHAPVPFDRHWRDGAIDEDGEESQMSMVHQRSVRRRRTLKPQVVDPLERSDQPSCVESAPAYKAGEAQGTSEGDDPSVYRDEKSSQHYASSQTQKARRSGESSGAGDDGQDEGRDSEAELPLVRPHAKISWDDTPNNSARYNNPFYACDIDNFLWLPRNPMTVLNLCDTIEWHGAAFVSSEGGEGIIGEWEEDEEDEEKDLDDDMLTTTSRLVQLDGNEEIVLSAHLAQHLERSEAEAIDVVPDPAAGLSKKVREDYEKTLEAQDRNSISDASQVGELLSQPRMQRHSSNITADSHRSPPPSVRHELDDEFDRIGVPLVASTSQNQSHANAFGQTQTPRTHWAPEPDHVRDHHDPDTLATAASMASLASTKPRRKDTVTPDARHRYPSGTAAASTLAGDTQSRAVTMQKALQAEVLEEERRRAVKDLVSRTQSRKGSIGRVRGMRGGDKSGQSANGRNDTDESFQGATAGSVAGEEVEGPDEGDLTQSSTILRRHQRGVDRRIRSSSVMSNDFSVDGCQRAPSTIRGEKGGTQGSHSSADPQRSPSVLRGSEPFTSSPLPAPALEGGSGLLPTLSISSRFRSQDGAKSPSAPSVAKRDGADEMEMSDLARQTHS